MESVTQSNRWSHREWIVREWARPGATLGLVVAGSMRLASSLRGEPFLTPSLFLMLGLAVAVGWVAGYCVGGLIRKYVLREDAE